MTCRDGALDWVWHRERRLVRQLSGARVEPEIPKTPLSASGSAHSPVTPKGRTTVEKRGQTDSASLVRYAYPTCCHPSLSGVTQDKKTRPRINCRSCAPTNTSRGAHPSGGGKYDLDEIFLDRRFITDDSASATFPKLAPIRSQQLQDCHCAFVR